MRHQQNQFKYVKCASSKQIRSLANEIILLLFNNKRYENNKAQLRVVLNLRLW